MEFSSMNEKMRRIKIKFSVLSNQIIDDGAAGVKIERNTLDEENRSVGDGGITGDQELNSEMADVEAKSTRRKRGRPEKHEVHTEKQARLAVRAFQKNPKNRHRRGIIGRPRGRGRLQLLAAAGGIAFETAGGRFTPYVIKIAAGQDMMDRISSFTRKGPRAICILSATGAVSSVTLHGHGLESGSILSYEGWFEILSLSGSYIRSKRSHGKKGMVCISLAKPDGQVFGGAVASSLVAAAPIQLIVGSFKQTTCNAVKNVYRTALSQPPTVTKGMGEADGAPFTSRKN